MLRVKNAGDKPFLGRYRQQWIEIPVGGEMILETGAIHAWLGNPAAKNTPTWKQRDDEVRRVQFMWCGERIDSPGAWEEMHPRLEVFDMNGGRYWTVADDPDGTTHANTEMSADVEKEALIAAVRELQERLNKIEKPEKALPMDSKIPKDAPSRVKVADG